MTLKEAKKLNIGDRVKWIGDDPANGTVCDKGYTGVTIRWDEEATGDRGDLGSHTSIGFHWDDLDSVLKNIDRI